MYIYVTALGTDVLLSPYVHKSILSTIDSARTDTFPDYRNKLRDKTKMLTPSHACHIEWHLVVDVAWSRPCKFFVKKGIPWSFTSWINPSWQLQPRTVLCNNYVILIIIIINYYIDFRFMTICIIHFSFYSFSRFSLLKFIDIRLGSLRSAKKSPIFLM